MTGLLSLLVALAFQAAATPAPAPAPDPRLVRIYVQPEVAGAGIDLEGKRQSVKDLMSSLAGKKKTLAVVAAESDADAVVELAERSVVTPKFVMGLGPRPGESTALATPQQRQPVLRVTLRSGQETLGFTNKNKPIESPTGWKMAAGDVAGQIEKWAAAHRDEIVKRRGSLQGRQASSSAAPRARAYFSKIRARGSAAPGRSGDLSRASGA
jgi:hypothetical protein